MLTREASTGAPGAEHRGAGGRCVGALKGWPWTGSPRRQRWQSLPPCLSFGAQLSVYLCDLINAKNEHKEVGTRLTIMSRGPSNVFGRCLKPLSASAKRGEHSLAVVKRLAYFVHLCDRPPVLVLLSWAKQNSSTQSSTIQLKCVGALERARRADQSTYKVHCSEVRGSKVVAIGVHEPGHAHEHHHRRRGTLCAHAYALTRHTWHTPDLAQVL